MAGALNPPTTHIESGHAFTQGVVDWTPEARIICQDVRASLFLVLERATWDLP